MWLRARTEGDANTGLCKHVFKDHKAQLVDDWSIDSTGESHMRRHGYDVLAKSISEYLTGNCVYHEYITSNSADGCATLSRDQCSRLRSIVQAKTPDARHVMVLRAVRKNVLKKSVLQFASGASRPMKPLESGQVWQPETSDIKDDSVTLMLIDKKDGGDSGAKRSRKRRRTAPKKVEAETTPDDGAEQVLKQ